MTKRIGLWLTAGVVLAITSLAVAGDDLATIEKKIKESWDKHKSMTAKYAMTMQMNSPGFSMDTKSEGTYEFMRKAGKVYSRTELKTSGVTKVGDQETKADGQSLMIVDGEYVYTITEAAGQKTAVKGKLDPLSSGDPIALLDMLKKDADVKVLPEETLDGHKVYVVELTPKDKAAGGGGKSVWYFLQDGGVTAKTVAFGPDGKPMTTLTMSDIKFDVDIKPERFKAPEGVKWDDQTGGPAKPATEK